MSVTDEGTWIGSEPGGVGALAAWTALDGRPRVASSGTDGSIQIWDPESAEPVSAPVPGQAQLVLHLGAWAWPGGRLLVSTSEDGSVYAWDVSSDDPVGSRLDGHRGWVPAVCFWDTPAGPRLATAGQDDGTVRLWDPLAGTELGPPLLTGQGHLAALASWPAVGGDLLAVGFNDGRIEIWDIDGRRRLDRHTLRHDGGLWALCAWTDPSGAARLASSGPDDRIRLWDPDTGAAAGEPLAGHSGWVPILTACPQPGGGTALISAAADGTVRIWDVSAPAPTGRLIEGTGGALPSAAVWTSTGGSPRVAVAQRAGVCSYDIATGQAVGNPLVGHVAGMWALTSWQEPDGTRLALGGDSGIVQVWNADTGQTAGRPLTGHTAAIWQLVHYRDAAGRSMLASTGDDGTVRLWDPQAGTALATLAGHRDWVPALIAWTTPAGTPMLISAGIDGTIRRWDPLTRSAIGAPLTGHEGRVLSLAAWDGAAGPRLASGGDDGTIRIWDPVTGEPAAEPWTGHDGWVRTLSVWQGPGRHLLISGGYDGTVRLWDLDTGAPVHEPLRAHAGRVGAVWTWAEPDGGARLVTAGADGVICRWDLDRVAPMEPALRGHEGGIWAVTGWTDAQGEVRLATSGQDGTVRLWDPRRARAVRTLEIGPVSIWGVSDAPTKRDVIGRQALAEAIAQQIRHPGGGPAGDGPTVVGIEGPWGCGKSTLMNLVRELLREGRPVPAAPQGRGLTVRAALRHIAAPGAGPQPVAAGVSAGVVTAWFNPWAYQSGEQIWAGLASEIIDAADGVLYTTTADRQAYWLRRNLGQVDRFALRRALRRRTRSPIFGLSAAAFLAPAVVTLLGVEEPVSLAGMSVGATWLATGVAVTTMLAGVAHTLWRRRFGLASAYLPPVMLDGPAMDVPRLDAPAGAEPEPDPLRRARSGALYLYQHHVADLIDDLTEAGHQLVVFVDDIDRCRPGTIAEVFEAINVFLADVVSRSGLRARFVVGLDSGVVAGHLDQMYRDHGDPTAVHHGEDPSPGWAFLRKLIQLPVLVPQVSDRGLARLVDSVTGQGAPPPLPAVPVQRAAAQLPAPLVAAVPAHRPASRPVRAAHTRVRTLTWRSAERHPQVRALLLDRLRAQPVRSIRETKRLINVWQLYARLMEGLEPLSRPDALIARARHLLILAEIVTRWPALQRGLHRHVGGTRGLRLLAGAAADEQAWQAAVRGLGLDGSAGLTGLRELLIGHDGAAVADLADQVL
ncbi:P-loop NTPase fold protein [Catellatospora bangladeshensis]|uniref:KAP NTPase domain-containing protein n=1 Tax=Catellatospora bangladeshensis TaxID=310355 RepID=A0A8J3JMD6_9ACTN|nr:P-loop NTPase fold protein [Catellatospora bangladeshensis]GIF81615.1 hypothetical protein Cba03nite_29640 [Catellatospora bangladeshensis]